MPDSSTNGLDTHAAQAAFFSSFLDLPQLDESLQDMAAPLLADPSKTELEYTHFSIIMHKERRAPILTAVNVDGAQYQEVERDGKWVFDGRIDRKYQLGNEAYKDNPLDKGHMVRRRDPMWGKDAYKGQDDTFCYTNAALQHADLNQRHWNDLENHILADATSYPRKITVFTGPVFREDDPLFDNKGKLETPTRIPMSFWKVEVWNEKGVGLKGEAYVMSQKEIWDAPQSHDEHQEATDFSKWRVPLSQLEEITHLEFGDIQDDCKKARRIA